MVRKLQKLLLTVALTGERKIGNKSGFLFLVSIAGTSSPIFYDQNINFIISSSSNNFIVQDLYIWRFSLMESQAEMV